MLPRSRSLVRVALSAAVAAVAAVAVTVVVPHPGGGTPAPETTAELRLTGGGNPVTPGHFKGYGFDQCVAPGSRAMKRWMYHSPFLAVGIYISGESRGCRDQPHLTPKWVRQQLRRGWELLPITLGPQAFCHPGFPRYGDDETIKRRPGSDNRYGKARRQGRREAIKSVRAAKALGIRTRSTLWYDLEGFDITRRHCRESALAFLSGWSYKIRKLGYVSGVYSSAGSGIKALDDARVHRPGRFTLPQRIWIARWDGKANTSTSYIRSDGWRPGGRMKQYRGGHRETHGGVTINIDSNFAKLGKGMHAPRENHCGGVRVNFWRYKTLRPPTANSRPPGQQVKALKCLLREKGYFPKGSMNRFYGSNARAAAASWKRDHGFSSNPTWWPGNWMSLLAAGKKRAQKWGSAGGYTRRVQRALNAADPQQLGRTHGRFDQKTRRSVMAYQRRVGLRPTGIVTKRTWHKLQSGVRK
jgi:hypothetical protein